MLEINKIYNEDCLIGMQRIDDNSIDCILTDPPYLYLKNQKLDRPFDEQLFFSEAKRVLKPTGFVVMFGRGKSFYRWNTILADLDFAFKEEIVWNKSYSTSPLMNISRIHETVSIHTKKNGTINKVKVPYIEMKSHDIDGIVTDIKRLKTCFKNTKSLNAVLAFLENNCRDTSGSIVRTDYGDRANKYEVSYSSKTRNGDRSTDVMQAITYGMNEKSIIRTDFKHNKTAFKYDTTGSNESAGTGDRSTNVMQSIAFGMNEKSIIKQAREHYATIHPTQKPVRLLERILALVSKEGDLILDPFSGSASTAIAARNTGRNFIGFEIDKEYYNTGNARLEAFTRQQRTSPKI
jgi:site-specific DNA-methyltransferase (adenine-specific)